MNIKINMLRSSLNRVQSRVSQLEGALSVLKSQYDEKEKRYDEITKIMETSDLIHVLLRHSSEYAKQQIVTKIEDIVSNALCILYGPGHKFKMVIVEKRNQHEIEYFLEADHVIAQIKKPFDQRGGGKITMAAMALQLAIGEVSGIRGPIIIDEPTKSVDGEAVQNVAWFLKQFAEEFNRQIILITHRREMSEVAGVSIHVKKHKGLASVEVKRNV